MQEILQWQKLEFLQKKMDEILTNDNARYCIVSHKKAITMRYKEGNPPQISGFPSQADVKLCQNELLQSPIVIFGENLYLIEQRNNVFLLENYFNKLSPRMGILVASAEAEAIIGCFYENYDLKIDYESIGKKYESVLLECFDKSVLGDVTWSMSDNKVIIYNGVRFAFAQRTNNYNGQGCTIFAFMDGQDPEFPFQCQLLQSIQKDVFVLICLKDVNFNNVQNTLSKCDSQNLNVLVCQQNNIEELQQVQKQFGLYSNKYSKFLGCFNSLQEAIGKMQYKVILNERKFALIAHLVLFGLRLAFTRKPVYGLNEYYAYLWDGAKLPEEIEQFQKQILIISPNQQLASILVEKRWQCGSASVAENIFGVLCNLVDRQAPVLMRCNEEDVQVLNGFDDLYSDTCIKQQIQIEDLDISEPFDQIFEEFQSEKQQVSRDEAFIIASKLQISAPKLLKAMRSQHGPRKNYYQKHELQELLQEAEKN